MVKYKKKKAKSVLIYAFYGKQKDTLMLMKKKYKDIGFVWSVPKVEVKEKETVIDAVVRFMEIYALHFIPMKDQDKANIPCFVNPEKSDDCVCTVYGLVDNQLCLDLGFIVIDKEEALRILEEENVDISTYYLLLMFVAGCMK